MTILERTGVAVLLLTLGTVAVAGKANACICSEPLPPRKALKEAKAVFVGEVTDVQEDDAPVVQLKPLTVWKGLDPGAERVEIEAPLFEGCTFVFSLGQKYLVYAYDGPTAFDRSAPLVTNSCTRSTRLSRADEDLRRLGKPRWTRETPHSAEHFSGRCDDVRLQRHH